MANPDIATLLASQRALDAVLVNNGGIAAAGVAPSSTSSQSVTTELRVSGIVVPMVDAAGVVAYGSVKLFDFPKGYIGIESVVANLTVGKSSAGVNATFDGDFSIGSVAAAGDATLTSTEADIVASAATPQAVAGVTTARSSKLTATTLDGTVTTASMYLNVLVDDADHDVTTTPANLLFTGTVTATWRNMGR